MSNKTDGYGREVTVLRGDALRDARHTAAAPSSSVPGKSSGVVPKTDGSGNSAMSIYGVPVSAVQHCCGRGCKHCLIYWHRMKT